MFVREIREILGGWGRPPQVVSPQIVRRGMFFFNSSTSLCLGAPIRSSPATHDQKQNKLTYCKLSNTNMLN